VCKLGKEKPPRLVVSPAIDKTYALGNFYGACQGNPGISGAGEVFFLKENHLISFKVALGEGTIIGQN